jgi:hypothetical protein
MAKGFKTPSMAIEKEGFFGLITLSWVHDQLSRQGSIFASQREAKVLTWNQVDLMSKMVRAKNSTNACQVKELALGSEEEALPIPLNIDSHLEGKDSLGIPISHYTI